MVLSLVLLAALILIGFRRIGLNHAESKAVLAADLVRASLGSAMQHDLAKDIDSFLDPLLRLDEFKAIRVVRGPMLDAEYGAGSPDKEPQDALERAVLKDGHPQGRLTEQANRVLYRVVVPFVATNKGGLNCMACHDVSPGTVLGAVSVVMDLTADRQAGMNAFLVLTGVAVLLYAALVLLFIRFMRGSFTRPIRGVIDGLATASKQFTEASGQVAMASNDLAGATGRLAASADQTLATLTDMTAGTRDNADKAREASNLANDAGRIMEEGQASAARMTEAVTGMQQTTEQSAVIIRTIDEIAFQTNLLALNAAVEAARAGDVGRGFSVVAEEVRNLARRSAEAARQTSALLESGQTQARSSMEVAGQVQQALQEVGGVVAGMCTLMQEVAVSSERQSADVKEAAGVVSGMQETTEGTAASAEETAATSEELAAQAQQLLEIVGVLQTLVDGANASNGNGNGKRRSGALSSDAPRLPAPVTRPHPR
ncbi:MAG TPA: methyl-accepting chemotaxis protein [bacterium]|nr:methyl-accepting chemotaxis protein [bacterium]